MSVNRITQIETRLNDPGLGMQAAHNTPWIGVYMLSQTLFCRRAGLLTLELGQADDGEEFSDMQPDAPQKLSWMEEYDDAMIAEALARHWNEVLNVLSYLGAWLSLCLAIYFSYSPSLGTCMAASMLVFVPWSLRELSVILELDYRRREAAASRILLDISGLGREERIVNWWQLRKAGFSVSKPQEAHRDEQMRLQGKPFLILQYSGLKIPVVRKHCGTRELHSQNRARVSAYCHLLEVTEQVQAPFGVFMFAGSYEVVIVPNDPSNRSLFERGLERSLHVLGVQKITRPHPDSRAGCIKVAKLNTAWNVGDGVESFRFRNRGCEVFIKLGSGDIPRVCEGGQIGRASCRERV